MRLRWLDWGLGTHGVSGGDSHEGLCHDHRRGLWTHHGGACLACHRGRVAPGDGAVFRADHPCRRRPMFLGVALAQALAALVTAPDRGPSPTYPFPHLRIVALTSTVTWRSPIGSADCAAIIGFPLSRINDTLSCMFVLTTVPRAVRSGASSGAGVSY